MYRKWVFEIVGKNLIQFGEKKLENGQSSKTIKSLVHDKEFFRY